MDSNQAEPPVPPTATRPRWVVGLACTLALTIGLGGGWILGSAMSDAQASDPPPSPSPTPSASPSPTSSLGLVNYAGIPNAQTDTSAGVTSTLNWYLTAVNENRLKEAYNVYTPRLRKQSPYEKWAAGYASTINREAQVLAVSDPKSGRVNARVKLVSEQDPAHAPDKSSACLVWDLTYVFTAAGSGWQIDDVIAAKQPYTPCPKPAAPQNGSGR